MQISKLKQITFNVNNGAPEMRLKAAEEAIPDLRQEQHRLSDKARSHCREFATTLAAWTSRDVGEALRPVGVEQDLRDARLIKLIAVFLTLTELALTVVVSLVFAVSAPFLLLVALVSILALKVGLLALWRNPLQPQQTRQRLRRYIIGPSLVVTMLALGVLVFARSAGVLALLLLPLINLALCSLSLGCLGLAAGLFALGYLMSWSKHAEQRFNALEREAVETSKVLQRVEKVAEELRATQTQRQAVRATPAQPQRVAAPNVMQPRQAPVGVAEGVPRPSATVRQQVSWLALFGCALVLSGSGCKVNDGLTQMASAQNEVATSAKAAPAASTPVTQRGEGLWLELWLDWSRSADDQSFGEAVRTLIAALPEMVLAHGITRVTAHQFSDRGWSAPEIFSLDLPLAEPVAPDEASALFGGAKKQQEAQARAQQLARLRQALAVITPEKLLPGNVVEPPCTDVRGCLLRIAASARAQRRLVVMITDLDDSCSHQLPELSLATANTALVVVILPELPPPAAITIGNREHSSPDQLWLHRRAELLRAVPDAVAIPAFGDPRDAVKQALANFSNQPKR